MDKPVFAEQIDLFVWPEGEGWIPNIGVPPAGGRVIVILRSGSVMVDEVQRLSWELVDGPGDVSDIIAWRFYEDFKREWAEGGV